MAEIKKLTAVVEAEDRTAEGFKSAAAKVEGLQSKIENMQPAFDKMQKVGALAFGAITAAAGVAISGIIDAERAQRQLQHAIIDVSKGTKEQVEEIDKLSKSLEQKAGVDADAIKTGAAQLSTFGLQTDTVVKLTKVMADLTVNQKGLGATSDDFVGSANVIAKVLQGQFGILEKSGIRFTELQQEMIKTGTESQKAAAIIEGLNQNLRETTDTISGSTESQIAVLRKSFENVTEEIGVALLPTINQLLTAATPVIAKFGEWAQQNPELITQFVKIGLGLSFSASVIGTIGKALPTIITMFGAMTTAVKGLGVALAGPLGPVAAFIALAAAIYKVRQAWEGLQKDQAAAEKSQGDLASMNTRLKVLLQKTDDPAARQRIINQIMGNEAAMAQPVGLSSLFAPKPISAEAAGAGGKNVTINFNGSVAGDEGIKKIVGEVFQQADRQSTLSAFSSAGSAAAF